MEKKTRTLLVGFLVVVLLAACQSASGAPQGTGQFGPSSDMQTQIASNPDMQTQIASGGGFGRGQQATATPTQEPTATSTPQPTATVSPTAPAVQAARDYFTALENGDPATASKLVSAFSRTLFKMTAGDVADALTQQKLAGTTWSDLQVEDSQVFTDNTVLVHVVYQLTSKDAKTGEAVQTQVDELWPFRLEGSQWLYNWKDVIDYHTLDFNTKYTSGLSVTPLQVIRYSDRISLTVLAQNMSSDQTIVIGGSSQTLATFYFGDQSVDATAAQYIFEPLRSYSDVTIDVAGLYTSYPQLGGDRQVQERHCRPLVHLCSGRLRS